ncbi:hypothetical protein B0H13DRAFT_2060102 [Mycena leptocephala]|nr:hypothetical protein B0H13DRAFT_2060102 [Mycena leptocephala]
MRGSLLLGRLKRQRPPRSSTSLTAVPSISQSKSDSVPRASVSCPRYVYDFPCLATVYILHRLRVLVVGKTGAGKSSLISRAFGVTVKSISHENAANNLRRKSCFVLHDSMGFEPGDTVNLELARKFLEDRTKKSTPLMDRLHVIWLCIQIPTANGRVFETGDEEFIKAASAFAVPVIVVFTQFDKLCGSVLRRLPPNERNNAVCEERAEERFKEMCVKELEPFCGCTRRLVEDCSPGDTWLVSAMAQRTSVKTKIDGAVGCHCIYLRSLTGGRAEHWRKLASSVVFADRKLETCLNTVHFEVTASWNFHDPNEATIADPEFIGKIRRIAQLVTPDSAEAKQWFPTMANIQSVLDWAMGLGPPIAVIAIPAVAAVGVSLPEILRCFMGYIVDLTLILEQIFLVTLSKSSSPLTESDIDTAFQNYLEGGLGNVHREIREFVGHESFAKIARGDDAEEKIKHLIYKYSPSLKADGGVGEL